MATILRNRAVPLITSCLKNNTSDLIFSKLICTGSSSIIINPITVQPTCNNSRGYAAAAALHVATTQLPLVTGRPRVVILGSGWGAARLARDLDTKQYDLSIISPRNHMVFTPLLASCCVGTIETRSVTLSIVDIQPALRAPQNFFFNASAETVDHDKKTVHCITEDGVKFNVEYDILVVATGSQGSTFGIKGVEQYCHPLREAGHAVAIRTRLIKNWSLANIPGRRPQDRDRLLHQVIVGGGPTGVEFGGELADFVNKDLYKIDPDRARDVRITLIEANELLGSFDARLREYAAKKLISAGVHLVKGVVKEVRETELELQDGSVIPFGICVWSTGVGPTEFTLGLPFRKTGRGRIAVDDYLRVFRPATAEDEPKTMADVCIVEDPSMKSREEEAIKGTTSSVAAASPSLSASPSSSSSSSSPHTLEVIPGVYALGDCSANNEKPLPALAQVAEQQGKYLALRLNAEAAAIIQAKKASSSSSSSSSSMSSALPSLGTSSSSTHTKTAKELGPFVYRSLGAMATVGGTSAILQLNRQGQSSSFSFTGFSSWVAWRSAYLTRLGTMKARMFVATNWLISFLFGRDVSRY